MIFSSAIFLAWFLPFFLGVYFLSPKVVRRWIILAASLLFYSWAEPSGVLVMLAMSAVTFGFGLAIERTDAEKTKSAVLALGILLNLAVLGFFKYWGFIIENVNALIGIFGVAPMEHSVPALPIGISFYTFSSLSYLVDVARGQARASRNIVDFIIYTSMFPKIMQGPIARWNDIAPSIGDRAARFDNIYRGLRRFMCGLAKKVLVADVIGKCVNSVFLASPAEVPTLMLWVGAVGYMLQLYYDFGGYSDMAIGLGRMMNFRIPENFRYPYMSRSVAEFWRRWHITLGGWFRDYLFYPVMKSAWLQSLGSGVGRKFGKQAGKRASAAAALAVVWSATGLWHGASWTFVLWGLYYGIWITIEQFWLGKRIASWPRWAANLYLLSVVLIGQILFRSPSASYAASYVSNMVLGSGVPLFRFVPLVEWFSYTFVATFIFAAVFAWPVAIRWRIRHRDKAWGLIVLLVMFVVSMAYATTGGYVPNMYFRF